MEKHKLLKKIIEKLTDKQLLSFVKSLNNEQIRTLFWLKSWTNDELRSLFDSMGQWDLIVFCEEVKSMQLQILLGNMIGDDDDDEDKE